MSNQTPRTGVAYEHWNTHEEARDYARQLERELNETKAQLTRICKEAFGNDDTIGGEPGDDYVIRQVAKLRQVAAQLAECLSSYTVITFGGIAKVKRDQAIAAYRELMKGQP